MKTAARAGGGDVEISTFKFGGSGLVGLAFFAEPEDLTVADEGASGDFEALGDGFTGDLLELGHGVQDAHGDIFEGFSTVVGASPRATSRYSPLGLRSIRIALVVVEPQSVATIRSMASDMGVILTGIGFWERVVG